MRVNIGSRVCDYSLFLIHYIIRVLVPIVLFILLWSAKLVPNGTPLSLRIFHTDVQVLISLSCRSAIYQRPGWSSPHSIFRPITKAEPRCSNIEGLYVSLLDKGSIREVLKNWPLAQESRICVVTDGSRILGTFWNMISALYLICGQSHSFLIRFG